MSEQKLTTEMIAQACSWRGNLTVTLAVLKLARYTEPPTYTVQTLRHALTVCPQKLWPFQLTQDVTQQEQKKEKQILLNWTNNITVNQEKGKCEKELREILRKSYKKKQSTYNYKEVKEKIIDKTKRQQK